HRHRGPRGQQRRRQAHRRRQVRGQAHARAAQRAVHEAALAVAASRDPSCPDASRRYDLRGQELLNGIDYVEVASDLRTLSLYFIARAPDWLTPAHVSISGGRRIRGIRALEVEVCRAE